MQNHVAGCAITIYACPACGYERRERETFFEEGLETFYGNLPSAEVCEKANSITKTWYLSEPLMSSLGPLGAYTERALGCIIAAGIWLRAAHEKLYD